MTVGVVVPLSMMPFLLAVVLDTTEQNASPPLALIAITVAFCLAVVLMWWRSRQFRTVAAVIPPLWVTLFLLGVVLETPEHGTSPRWALLAFAAALGQGVALVWRRSRPVQVTAVAVAGGVVMHVIAPEGVVPVAGLVAVFALAANRSPTVSLPGLLAVVGIAAGNFWTSTDDDAYWTMAMAVAAWALGEIARNRRVAIVQQSRHAVMAERARIAREMHDVIAHSVSVIVVQAAAARDVFDAQPDQARQSLRSIEATGREALGELRRLLAAVRPITPPTTPLPTNLPLATTLPAPAGRPASEARRRRRA